MHARDTNEDAAALALHALTWTLGEPMRAERLLTLTGLTPDDLRTRADSAPVLAAVLGFLESHEPDLLACAAALSTKPTTLVMARERLDRA